VVPVNLGLGDADGGIKTVVGQGRVQDLVSAVSKAGRLHAAGRTILLRLQSCGKADRAVPQF
jgi:hypothetical protein